MARIWIAILAVTRLTMESSNNDWMNCIDDPKRLGTNLAFAAMTIVCMGMCSAHGNKDADDAGERHSSQHCGKISRTVHSVLHWFVRRILVDGATPGLGSDDNGLDHADAAAVDDANRQGPADGPVFGRPPCSPSPESSSVQQMLRAGAVSAQHQPTEQRYCALVGGLPGSLPPPGSNRQTAQAASAPARFAQAGSALVAPEALWAREAEASACRQAPAAAAGVRRSAHVPDMDNDACGHRHHVDDGLFQQ
jgi:hypothetical protein